LSGDIKNASKVLGRNFNVSGTVAHGEKRGRKLGYPTANLKTSTGIMLPSNGIYATFAFINGSKFMSATSIGTNPTFEGNTKTVETYILNFDKDIYGQPIKIEFIKRLRDEMKFSSVESLITQMDIDIIKIEKILKI
jgi:riboflavin kinase/FMN adenylyltransferase